MKKLFVLLIIIIFSLSLVTIRSTMAKAQQNQQQSQEQNQEQNEEENENGDNSEQTESDEEDENDEELSDGNKGQINAVEHRSAVANFVQSLVHVADRQKGGIGEQVRVVAQQQNQSEETTIEAMETVQARSKIKTFLIGSDYKNLGALRSEIVQTRNRLDQLNRLMENIQDEGDKAKLQNQIQELEQEQTKIEDFIKAEESQFSLFGWLFKLIYGYKNLGQ